MFRCIIDGVAPLLEVGLADILLTVVLVYAHKLIFMVTILGESFRDKVQ